MNKDKWIRRDFCANHQNTVSQMQPIHFLHYPTKCPCSEQFHTIWGTCCCFIVSLHTSKKKKFWQNVDFFINSNSGMSFRAPEKCQYSQEVLTRWKCCPGMVALEIHAVASFFVISGDAGSYYVVRGSFFLLKAAWSFWALLDVHPSTQDNITCN